MNIELPIIALVLSAAAYALGRKDGQSSRPSILALIGLVIFVLAAAKFGPVGGKETWPLAGGLAVGAIIATLADWIGIATVSLGLGVAGTALMPLFGKGAVTAEISLAVGAMAGTIFARGGKFAAFAAVTGSAVATLDALGTFNSEVPAAAHFGSLIGTIALGAAVVMLAVRFKSWLWPIGAVILAGGGYFAAHHLGLVGVGLPTLLGVLTGVVLIFLLREDEADAFKMAVATVLWLGLATLAYGPARGFGMNVALFAGIAIPIALGRSRAVLSCGPLAVLVFFRLFNQIHGRESGALDISQHYVLIGLTVGAILPALYDEWKARSPRLPALAALLWSVLFVGIPVVITLLVGGKGLVGFIVGLGFGGLLLARRPSVTVQPLTVSMGVAASSVLVWGRMIDVDTVTRDEKMRFVAYSSLAIALVAIPLGLLVRPRVESNPS